MAKNRDKGRREAKKPKADKKPAATASTFLRPQPVSAKPTAKDAAR